jgi:hypothetical protein
MHLWSMRSTLIVNESYGPSARIAVELSEQAARDLVRTILAVLDQAEVSGQL